MVTLNNQRGSGSGAADCSVSVGFLPLATGTVSASWGFSDLATTCSWVSCVFQTSRPCDLCIPHVQNVELVLVGFCWPRFCEESGVDLSQNHKILRKIAFLKILPSETCFFSWILEIFQFSSWKMVS